jgi:pimeloyl-ACP methyl ester carboxylesterase
VNGPVFARLPEVRVPVLIVFGREDGLIPNPILHGRSTEEVARRGAARFPDARLRFISHAGHMVQFERPDEWNGAVLDFLKEKTP